MKCKTMIHLTGRNPIVLTDNNFSINDIDHILSNISGNRSGLITLVTDTNFIAFHSSQFVGIHFSSEDGTSFKQNDTADGSKLIENKASESNDDSDIDASEFVDSLDEFEDDEGEEENASIANSETIKNNESFTSKDEDDDPIYDIDSVDEPDSEADNINVNEL